MSVSPFNRSSLCSIFRRALLPKKFPRALVRPTYKLMALFAAMLSPLSAFAGPVTEAPDTNVGKSVGAFVTVNRLGESDREAALRDGKLLSHRRTADPFGIAVRGPFKGLPPVVEQPLWKWHNLL
jgi:hypothetical protein